MKRMGRPEAWALVALMLTPSLAQAQGINTGDVKNPGTKARDGTERPDDLGVPVDVLPDAAKRPVEQPGLRKIRPKRPGEPHIVKVHKDAKGYKLLVDGRATMVFGMNWQYMPIGENYSYDFWGKPDAFIEKALDDEMSLLKAMHVNVIRQYVGIPARWITYIYEKYGIYTVLNHPMGRYGFEMNGAYIPVTNYADPNHRAYLKNEILELVKAYRNTPGLMFWLLGNENNYGLYWSSAEIEDLPLDQQGDARAKHLYSLYGEITDGIHQLDDKHPVAIANGDLQFIELVAKYAPNIDIFGSNVYRGFSSGDLFDRVGDELGVPFVYTEFGSDAYNAKDNKEAQLEQAQYLNTQWQEIYEHAYGMGRSGTAIGGMVFQWSDGWWKYKQEENLDVHDNTASWATGAYAFDYVEGQNNMNEEWFGICAKEPNDANGHYKVVPRAAYYMMKEAFTLDPYAPTTTPGVIKAHFASLPASNFTTPYKVESTAKRVDRLEMVRVKNLALELTTFTTGGNKLDDRNREQTRFDHMQSAYIDIEVRPTSNIRANVALNVLGNVARSPIDEIYFENRALPIDVTDAENAITTLTSNERLKIYQASFEWKEKYFDLEGFYRVGHGHWGYEGDYFGIYPEAYYQPQIDAFNADAPAGFVLTGKRLFDGLKVAFGPQLWWGANPTIIGKYHKKWGNFSVTAMHQEDIAQLAQAGTSSVLPVPQTRKTAISGSYKWGPWKLEGGLLMAGTDRLGRQYFIAEEAKAGEPSYLDSGFYLLENRINILDTLGGKATLTYEGGGFNFYATAGYRGLVNDAGVNGRQRFAAWGLNESGTGNHYGVLSGAIYNAGNWSFGPNFLYQKPLVGPMPLIPDYFDPDTGIYYPGVRARNQFDDPFWVRANREMVGLEMLVGYDSTPATWQYAWNAVEKENAFLAGFLDFTYRYLPTSQDAAVSVSAEGFIFAFDGAPPAQNLWELRGRMYFNPTPKLRFVGDFYGGIAQANGTDERVIPRTGFWGRLLYERLSLAAWFKINDWGPFDYHRDFNFTYPLQALADLSYSLSLPKWFLPWQTRFGVRSKVRILDQFSNRFDSRRSAYERMGPFFGTNR
jgi:beta-galactosidase